MIFDLCTYLIVFMITAIMASLYQKYCPPFTVKVDLGTITYKNHMLYLFWGCCFLFPIIAMYGLRYGIGTDYNNYKQLYDVLHETSFSTYWMKHSEGSGVYYVELLYYFLNVIMPNYVILQWSLAIIIYTLLCLALRQYYGHLSYAYAIFIYLATQFIYSMNATRFSIALCFLLLSYIALAKGRDKRFFVCVILASLFHTSALFCLPIYFLKEYKHKYANSKRNITLLFLIILFPLLVQYVFNFASIFPVFARYFSTCIYAINTQIESGFKWLIHIVPIIMPLILFCRKEIFYSADTSIYFRISLMEIPFRMLGIYNTYFTRYARCSQIVLVILIPLIIARVTDKKKRTLLASYYVLWYVFYFAYYAIVNDQGASLPYMWIFSKSD